MSIQIVLRINSSNRDVLNCVYFNKRMLYVAVLYKALFDHIQEKNLGNIALKFFKGDNKKVFISITPKIQGWDELEIRLFPSVRRCVDQVN